AIEDVAFENRAVFARQSDVTAVIECFFKRLAEFVFGGEFRNPAFDGFMLAAGSDFQLIGMEFARTGRHVRYHVGRNSHARVSSICGLEDSIWTSGLNA